MGVLASTSSQRTTFCSGSPQIKPVGRTRRQRGLFCACPAKESHRAIGHSAADQRSLTCEPWLSTVVSRALGPNLPFCTWPAGGITWSQRILKGKPRQSSWVSRVPDSRVQISTSAPMSGSRESELQKHWRKTGEW